MQAAYKPRISRYGWPYLSIIYLIWYDVRPESAGYYDRPDSTDYTALALLLLVMGVSGYTLVKAIKNKPYRRLMMPLAAYLIFQFRILEGWSVVTLNNCDLSVCTSIQLKQSGFWRETTSSQLGTRQRTGTYTLDGGRVILYHDLRHLNPFTGFEMLRFRNTSSMHYYDKERQEQGEWLDTEP